MNKKDKELLFKDICARLPYVLYFKMEVDGKSTNKILTTEWISDIKYHPQYYKAYLRPMSSMTEEERIEFSRLLVKRYCEEDWEGHISTSYCIEIDNVYTDDENGIKYPSSFSMDAIDWLNAHHFDYRGLIEKGLALEASEEMYKN